MALMAMPAFAPVLNPELDAAADGPGLLSGPFSIDPGEEPSPLPARSVELVRGSVAVAPGVRLSVLRIKVGPVAVSDTVMGVRDVGGSDCNPALNEEQSAAPADWTRAKSSVLQDARRQEAAAMPMAAWLGPHAQARSEIPHPASLKAGERQGIWDCQPSVVSSHMHTGNFMRTAHPGAPGNTS
jgi:hypothetical protein